MAHADDLNGIIIVTRLVHKSTYRNRNQEMVKLTREPGYGFYTTDAVKGEIGQNMYIGSADQLILGANVDRNDAAYDRLHYTEPIDAPHVGYDVLADRNPDSHPTQEYLGPVHYKGPFGDV